MFLMAALNLREAAAADNAPADYAFAQKCYHNLDKSTPKGWKRCIRRFEAITKKYPNTPYARKALFSIGRLVQERYERSKEATDLALAFKTYNEFLKNYPSDSMADDALFYIARLRFEKQGDKKRALHALDALLARYPGGDQAEAAAEYRNFVDRGEAMPQMPQAPPKPVIDLSREPQIVSDPTPAVTPPADRQVAPQPSTAQTKPIPWTVVIDPGHGGKDPGAKGPHGTEEAEIALQVARKLAWQLKKSGVQVYLTRTGNQDLSLEERADFAARRKADFFISLHANAHRSAQVFGIQTFYLNNATTEAARQLAERENRVAGRPLPVTQTILNTMLQNANTEESRDLALAVHKGMVGRLAKSYAQVKDLKVETALFDVLLWTKCPSILVETSFITHAREEARLKDSRYQWTLAEGMAQGIKKYLEGRHALAAASSL